MGSRFQIRQSVSRRSLVAWVGLESRTPRARWLWQVAMTALAAWLLAGCLGNNAIGIDDGEPAGACVVGQTPPRTCGGTCPTGYVSQQICAAGQVWSDCGCFPAGMAPGGVCTPRAVRQSSCRTCGTGQIAQETCTQSGQWADCECINRTQICAPSSVTHNSCATCAAGMIAGQRCNAAGTEYGGCECFPSGGSTGCTNGYERACADGGNPSCASGQVQRQVCESGSWSACRCVGSGTGTGTVCTANQSTGTTCAASCPSGQTGRQYCNAAGSGYECRCMTTTGTVCTPGATQACTPSFSCAAGQTPRDTCNAAGDNWNGCQCVSTGGGSTGNCGGGTLVVRARSASQLVRCWGTGQTWTSTGRELRAQLDGNQCGYSECVTGSLASNGAFIEDPYFDTGRNGNQGSIRDMFEFVGVEGRHTSLNDQTSVARMWTDTRGRTKGVVAVNIDRLGGTNAYLLLPWSPFSPYAPTIHGPGVHEDIIAPRRRRIALAIG